VIAAEFIHFFIYRKRYQTTLFQWGLSQLVFLLAVIPGFFQVIRGKKITAGLAWITSPSLKDLLSTFYNYLFPQNYHNSWFFIAVSFAAGLAFFVLGAFLFNFRKSNNHWLFALKNWFRISRILSLINNEFVLVALWFVCPILLPFIYSNIFTPIFLARYTICAAPAFYLLVASAILCIRRIVPVSIALIALMIVIVPGLQDYYSAPVNEQWREAAEYVQEYAQANDTIVFAPDEEGYQHLSFNWYYHGFMPACGISSTIKDDRTLADTLSNCILGHERYWVIIRGTQEVVNLMKSFFLNPDKTTYRLAKEQEFVQISVYLFEMK
jgi:hypothetical protein